MSTLKSIVHYVLSLRRSYGPQTYVFWSNLIDRTIGWLKRLWIVYDGAEDGQGRDDLLLIVGGWMVGQL